MTVYVDNANIPFGRMRMSHLWADSLDELLSMVDRIGVQRKWLQHAPKASWVHFDIAMSKKELAIKAGAVLTDKYGPMEHIAKMDIASGIDYAVRRGTNKLAMIEKCRAQNAGD